MILLPRLRFLSTASTSLPLSITNNVTRTRKYYAKIDIHLLGTTTTTPTGSKIMMTRSLASEAAITADMNHNITYSGGQRIKGQGEFFGNGGARSTTMPSSETTTTATTTTISPRATISVTDQKRSQMIALATDVEHIKMVMKELELLEHILHMDQEEHNDEVTNRSVELRGSIKHLVTNKDFLDCLDRLEYEGRPIWGLSSEEHDLILLAREKINQS